MTRISSGSDLARHSLHVNKGLQLSGGPHHYTVMYHQCFAAGQCPHWSKQSNEYKLLKLVVFLFYSYPVLELAAV